MKSYLVIICPNSHEKLSSYRLNEWFWAMFEPTPTWPNFDFDQLFMWIGPNNDQIWLPKGYTNDFEQCSNRLQFDLISLWSTFHMNLGTLLFAPIWFYLHLFGTIIPFLSIFSLSYLYLPLFTYIWLYLGFITLILGIFALNCPDFTKYAIFTLYMHYSIETAPLCKILE